MRLGDTCGRNGWSAQERQVRSPTYSGIDDPALSDPNFKIYDIAVYTRRLRRRSAARLAEETTESWLGKFDAAGLPVPAGPLRERVRFPPAPPQWPS